MAIISYKDADGEAHWPSAQINTAKYYAVEWTEFLAAENDSMTEVTWTVPTGLTDQDEYQVGNQARIKLKADTAGNYKVLCEIATVEGGDTQKFIQVMNLEVTD